jgi:hypothetical protein
VAIDEHLTPRSDDGLALTFDGKGVPVRPQDLRPATRKLSTRLTKGEKRNGKRMAEVAAVYAVAPWVRRRCTECRKRFTPPLSELVVLAESTHGAVKDLLPA